MRNIVSIYTIAIQLLLHAGRGESNALASRREQRVEEDGILTSVDYGSECSPNVPCLGQNIWESKLCFFFDTNR